MAAKKRETKTKAVIDNVSDSKKLFIFLYVEKIGRVGRCEEGRRMQKKGESE